VQLQDPLRLDIESLIVGGTEHGMEWNVHLE
jgi:hypothetical protein